MKLKEAMVSMLLVQTPNQIIIPPIERLRSKKELSVKILCRLVVLPFSFYKGKFFAYPVKQETKITSN